MSRRVEVLHAWMHQVETLLPDARVTRVRVLALLAAGVLWSGTVTLLKAAAALPLPVADPSTERRFTRFLTNPAVTVETLWQPLLPALLRSLGQRDLVLVFDPTPYRDCATILVVGVIWRHRVLPLAWQVVPQQEPWPQPLRPILGSLLATIAAALPPGTTATLLADRGLVGPTVIDCARAVGFHVILRLRAGAGEETRVRLGDGPEQRVADLPTGPGQRFAGRAAIFKEAGWRDGALTIHWDAAAAEPWVLFSDRPAGPDRVREYRKRARAEATYADEKGAASCWSAASSWPRTAWSGCCWRCTWRCGGPTGSVCKRCATAGATATTAATGGT